ncbi:MAG: metallophosphoesterase [Clostridia bacterium]|nr:metallophosphoesterase [Clostridia bacterium]
MKSKARKRIIAVVAAVFLTAVAFFTYFVFAVTNFREYGTSLVVNEDEQTLSYVGDKIKILQLSDVQTSNLVESAIAYPMLKRVVKRTEPDLIVLTGDNISNGSKRGVLNTFIRLMDSFEIPWALVFGNHDIRSALPPEEICKAYEESEYCLFKKGNIAGRYGNYYYKIECDGKVTYSLIFMDSADSHFTEEQVAWYGNSVAEISQESGYTVPSFAFYHIPIEETVAAHEAYALDSTIGTGRQVSEVRTQDINTGFFDKVIALGSTKALFFGHDHRNNTHINYQGVLFCYATKTGRTVYYERDSLGGNLITLYSDAKFTVERVDGK